MDASLIVLVAVVAAVTVRVFWRQILQIAAFTALVAVFVGILTLATESSRALGR